MTGLADLKIKLAEGEPVSPEEIAGLQTAMGKLADLWVLISTQRSAPISWRPWQTWSTPPLRALKPQLTKALAPLAQMLLESDGSAQAKDLKVLGEKLGLVLAALNSDDASSQQALELDATADEQSKLTAALAKLMPPVVNLDTAAAPVPVDPETQSSGPHPAYRKPYQ